MIALLLALALSQDPTKDLIEKLQADDPAVRDAAAQRLAELGKSAEPELRKAVNHPDPEVAGHVRRLLRNLEIDAGLTPRLKAALPGLLARLTSGDDHQWTRALLEAQRIGQLGRPDLEVLAAPAFRAARNDQERQELLALAQMKRFRSAAKEIEALLPNPRVGGMAAPALALVQGRDAVPALLAVLKNDRGPARTWALQSLSQLRATEALPAIRELLDDLGIRAEAARAYAEIAGRDALPLLKKMAGDSNPRIRQAGLSGLGATGLKEVGPEILTGFASLDQDVRAAAARAAGELRLKEAMPHLEAMLRDKEEFLRQNALNALETYRTRAAARAVVPLLHGKDEGLQEEAIRVLEESGIREGVPDILKLLDSKNDDLRKEAMDLLAVFGTTEAFDRVAKNLKDDSKEIRTTAVHALGAIDPARAAAVLVPLLKSEEHGSDVESWIEQAKPLAAKAELAKLIEAEKDEDRRAKFETLRDSAYGPTREDLIKRLQDEAAGVRALALGTVHTPEMLPHAVKLLKDPNLAVRFAAAQALVRLESKEILGALADPSPEVLCEAVRGVRQLELKEAVPALLPLLKSPLTPVLQEAAEALGRLGAAEAVPGLVELSRHFSPYVRASAARGLRDLRSPEAEALLKDPHPYVRRAAAEVGQWSKLPADRKAAARAMTKVEELEGMLEDPDRGVIDAAVVRLLEIGTKEAVVAAARTVDFRDVTAKIVVPKETIPALMELLGNPKDEVRVRAMGALSAAGAKEAIPRLIEMLGGRSPEEAIDALAGLDAREAVGKIAPFLKHHNGTVRKAAAVALGELGGVDQEAGLIELLDDPEEDVRHAAALALGGLGSATAVPKLIELLDDEDPFVGAALCLLGRREGVAVVVAAAESSVRLRGDLLRLSGDVAQRVSCLVALNALRSPALRARLDGKPLGAPVGATISEVAKAVASEAGLAFKDESTDEFGTFGYRPLRRGSLWRVLVSSSTLFDRTQLVAGDLEVILEDGRLRLVNLDEAVRFWKSWTR